MTSTTTTTIMLSSPTSLCSSSCITKSALLVHRKVPNFGVFTAKSHVGLNVFAQWSGLKHLGLPVTTRLLTKERKKKFRGVKVSASLFGVGAPEALVIGVVALLVFGPKGLAEVARNLGKTLRAFQPTIRELQEVSREFKSTLEREIGLDDIPNSTQSASDRMNTAPRPPSTASTDDPQAAVEINTAPRPSSTVTTEESQAAADPNGVASPNTAYSTEELLKITEEQLKASAAAQRQEEATNVEESKSEPQNQQQVVVKENADREGPSSERPETKT